MKRAITPKKNIDTRAYAAKNGVALWQIAEKLDMCDSQLSRILRKEFADDFKKEIFKIINLIKEEM